LHGRPNIILAKLVARGDGCDVRLEAESGKIAATKIDAGAPCAFGIGIRQGTAQACPPRMRDQEQHAQPERLDDWPISTRESSDIGFFRGVGGEEVVTGLGDVRPVASISERMT
jgi:hypothetical protein